MKFSVSSYSYNQYISKGEMTQLDALRKAAEQGFDGVEFTELRPENRKDATKAELLEYAKLLRSEAEALGIEIVAYLIGANLYNDDAEADEREVQRICDQLDIAKELGVKLLRHDLVSKENIDGKVIGFGRMLPTLAANVRKITEYGASLGIKTCSENHGFIAQDSDRVEAIFNAVAHENYGLLVDMGNFACEDEDSARAVSRLAPYAIHAHAKDFKKYPFGTEVPEEIKTFMSRGCNKLAGCAIGDGDIPVAQCVAILKKAKYDGYITIEFEGSKECVGEIALGLERLKAYAAD